MTVQFSIPVMIRLERFFRFDADMIGLVRTRSGKRHADLSDAAATPRQIQRTVAPTRKLVNSLLMALVESLTRHRTISLQAGTGCATMPMLQKDTSR